VLSKLFRSGEFHEHAAEIKEEQLRLLPISQSSNPPICQCYS
jgi:hypothetical protein